MRFIILGLLFSCAAGPEYYVDEECGTEPDPVASTDIEKAVALPTTLKWWKHANQAGTPLDLQDMMDCALRRWAAATCMPIDISYYPSHLIRQSHPVDMGGFSGYAWTGNNWLNSNIKINTDLITAEAKCQVAVHELGHVLRKSGGHPCPEFSMCYGSTSILNSRITQDDLNAVCSKYACQCQIPE